MKNAWKFSRFAAAALLAALLLTSGVLAAGGLVTAIGDHRPGWVKLGAADAETPVSVQPSHADAVSTDTPQPTEEPAASEDLASVKEPAPSAESASAEDSASFAESAPVEETVQPAEEVTGGVEPYIQADGQASGDWRLLLVNPWNALPEDYTMELVSLSNGLKVDQRIYEDLEAMLSACREAGLTPIVCSAYRTEDTQTRLYNNKIARLRSAGWTGEALLTEAARWVAPPGTSEHQTGLALDIVSAGYQSLTEAQEDTAEQQWLMEHCWEYGFILRYPENKTEITGIGYEPWHYRYVGRETAEAIWESGLCLEEYLSALPATELQEATSEGTPTAPVPETIQQDAVPEEDSAPAEAPEAESVPEAQAVPAEAAPEVPEP